MENNISKERLEQIINGLCGWASEHDEEFINVFLNAGSFSSKEAEHFELTTKTGGK